jgi:hypothetical protein
MVAHNFRDRKIIGYAIGIATRFDSLSRYSMVQMAKSKRKTIPWFEGNHATNVDGVNSSTSYKQT